MRKFWTLLKEKNPLSWLAGRIAHEVKAARGPVETRWQRFLAHFETLFVDSLFLNYILPGNLHRISEKMWRGRQPHYGQVRGLARRGIRTIINLRGKRDCASYYLEEEACRKHGIALVNFPMGSREAPKVEVLEKLEELFAGIEYPALIHCKAGSDRAGIMSALYLLVGEKQPVSVAKKQLSLRFGHIRQSKTGVLDAFLESYEAFNEKQPTPFMEWVRHHYDRAAVAASHKVFSWAEWLTTKALHRE